MDKNPELCLLAHSFDSYYRVAQLPKPSTVDWRRFERLVHNNKLSLLAYTRVLADPSLDIPPVQRTHFEALKEREVSGWEKFGQSIAQVNQLLEQTPYALVKTYRPFPYYTHDLDILVQDTAVIGEMVTRAGIPWFAIPRGSVQVEEPQWLHLEFYGRVMAGSIQVIDDDITLKGRRAITLGGQPTFVASPEVETVTLISDAVFRLYELKLGDMIYIYNLAQHVDWRLLETQARKYGWSHQFNDLVGVLNAYHRAMYGEPSPIEDRIGVVGAAPQTAPYTSGWLKTTRALASRSPRHLMKLPAYVSVRLKQNHPLLHASYVRFFQEPVGHFVLRYIYR